VVCAWRPNESPKPTCEELRITPLTAGISRSRATLSTSSDSSVSTMSMVKPRSLAAPQPRGSSRRRSGSRYRQRSCPAFRCPARRSRVPCGPSGSQAAPPRGVHARRFCSSPDQAWTRLAKPSKAPHRLPGPRRRSWARRGRASPSAQPALAPWTAQRLSGLIACACIHDQLLLSRYPTDPPLFPVVPCRSGDHAGIVGPVCHGLDGAMSWLMIMML
jgi:hypothetical protein